MVAIPLTSSSQGNSREIMIEIPLTRGHVAIIDDCDSHLAKKKWSALEVRFKDGSLRRVYAVRGITRADGKHRLSYLHREVMGTVDTKTQIDHRDGNGLDCRRANLRLCSGKQNIRNRTRMNKNNSSGYRGVRWNAKNEKWVAVIKVDRKPIHIGTFADRKEAAIAYNRAAAQFYGEFASFNEVN